MFLELIFIGGVIAALKKPAPDPLQNIQTTKFPGTDGRVMNLVPRQPVIQNQKPSSGTGVAPWRPNAPINRKRDSAQQPTWGNACEARASRPKIRASYAAARIREQAKRGLL